MCSQILIEAQGYCYLDNWELLSVILLVTSIFSIGFGTLVGIILSFIKS